jgi:hypothetical protein
MTDEAGTVLDGGQTPTPEPQGGGTPAPAPETPTNYTTVIGEDGSFKEGWKGLLPEDIRSELSLDTVKDIPGLAKQFVHAQKMIGRNKIVIPGEHATPSEIEAFHRALGAPESADDYQVNAPDEIKQHFDENLLGQAKKMAHSIGLNQKAFDALVSFRTAEIEAGERAAQEMEQRQFEEAEKLIVEQAGEALDEQAHFANKLIADNCPNAEYQEKLLEALNGNALRPYVFNFLANIQRKAFEQHGGIPQGDGSGNAMTPAMMESKAKELMETPGYADGTMKDSNPEQYKRLSQEITDLFNRASRAGK